MASKCIFVTGGAGYVGSHTALELLKSGYEVVAVDNFSNAVGNEEGIPESLRRVQKLAGRTLTFYKADLLDKDALTNIFNKHEFDCVIHFAALKAVGESCKIPLDYYRNNVGGTVTLLEVMRSFGVKNLIFSSSATVYGIPQYLPIDEKHPTGMNCTNPYGRTKYFIEEIMKDVCASEKGWNIILLRYFNPVGADPSGMIGEDPQGVPNNLMPYIAQVAIGRRPELQVFGDCFKTPDGTGVRDYIHVMDLAVGHVKALEKLLQESGSKIQAYNLGTGRGFSVLEVVRAFEEASGTRVPYRIVGKREGDVDEMYADSTLAQTELNWKAEKSLLDMCKDTWRWQSTNPLGYQSSDSGTITSSIHKSNGV